MSINIDLDINIDIDVEISIGIAREIESCNWAPGGVGKYQQPFSQPGSGPGDIAVWALDYLSPLRDWLNQLVGNREELARFRHEWTRISRDVDSTHHQLVSSRRSIDHFKGATARGLRKRLDELIGQTLSCKEWTGALAAALDLASQISEALHDAIRGAIRELANMAVNLIGWSWSLSSLDPFDRIDKLRKLMSSVDRFIKVIEQLFDDMFDAFSALMTLLHRLQPLIKKALEELRYAAADFLDRVAPRGGIVGEIFGSAAADLLKRDPRVGELNPDDLTPEQLWAYEQARATGKIDSIADFIRMNGYADSMGGEDRTAVDIKKIIGADGVERWVVALPSTQDWNALRVLFGGEFADTLKDYPATNDLDTNVALMLMDNPHLATTYERGVLQAMTDAGAKPGDNVIYTGFSQGGIMAANLASNPNNPYTVDGIITNGSPIETFNIPRDVKVLSFGHQSDVVHMLDGSPLTGQDKINQLTKGHQAYILPNPPNGTANWGVDNGIQQTLGAGVSSNDALSNHSTAGYHYSVTQLEQQNPGIADDWSHMFGQVVDHQVHSFVESQ